jgi:sortase (surface protein transpeptidase)
MLPPARGRRGRGAKGPAAALAALLAALALAAGCALQERTEWPTSANAQEPSAPAPPTSAPTPSTTTAPPSTSAPPTTEPPPPAEVGDPRRVRVPAIGVAAEVIPLALDANRKLIAPESFEVAGWNQAGPEPGEVGAAVIAGHVDSFRGPAVFFELRNLAAGDEIHVDRADGSTATFVVTHLERYPKTDVPDSVYEPTPDAQLRLITCGGDFDRSRRSYRDNIVVYASLR